MTFEAMIFAAGLGTRLGPLTADRPKALVEVDGVPMLERVARRLVQAGADRIVLNVCPFAETIAAYIESHAGFGVETVLSIESERPLETGGGLLHARPLLRLDGPVLLHNVDVLSDVDLPAMLEAHDVSGAAATLAVQDRETTRKLLFDDHGLLGRVDETNDLELRVREARGEVEALAFQGLHVVSPSFVRGIEGHGAFSILDPYLQGALAGAAIRPHRVDEARWMDIGRPEHLAQAAAWVQHSRPR